MKYISLGIITLNIIYLPLSSIMNSLKYTLIELLEQARLENIEKDFKLLFYIFFMTICKLLSGLGYIYFFIKSKSKRKQIIKKGQNQSISRLTKRTKKIVFVKSYFKIGKALITVMIAVNSIMEIGTTMVLVFLAKYDGYTQDENTMSILDFNLLPVQLLYLGAVNHIFKHKINYYHQYLSYILIFGGILIIFVPTINEEVNLGYKIPSYCGVYLVVVVQSLIEKWLMDMKYIGVQLLLLLEGLFSTVLCVIIGFVFDFADPGNQIFGTALMTFESTAICFSHWKMTIYFLFGLLASSLYYLFMMITRYHFSPTHCSVAEILSVFFSWIMLIANGMIKTDMWSLTLIGFILIIFGALIYNEIVILNFCRLDENTIPKIIGRSQNEFNESSEYANEEVYIPMEEIPTNDQIATIEK